MRLSSDRGETPIATYIKQKEDISTWYLELGRHGLNEEEIKILEEHLLALNGVADSQESAMLMVMDERISNFTLLEADKLRKGIAKKKPKEIESLEKLFYKKGAEQSTRKQLLDYVWRVQLHRQFGYSFSSLHTYAYSTIAVQEMNLYHFYPSIYWNTSNLIVESRGYDEDDEQDFIFEEQQQLEDIYTTEYDEEIEEDDTKKTRNVDYGKTAIAIGEIRNLGVEVVPPSINISGLTFVPDAEKNIIHYGIKGISGIGDSIIDNIFECRPFSSVEDFLNKVRINRAQMVNLIKSGAFDELEGKEREEIMKDYIMDLVPPKKSLTGASIQMLISYKLVPKQFEQERKLVNFTRYIRQTQFKKGDMISLDTRAQEYLTLHEPVLRKFGYEGFSFGKDNSVEIPRKKWNAIYNKGVDNLKKWIAENETELIEKIHKIEVDFEWNKYCTGTRSKWEMDSVGYYSGEHELQWITARDDMFDVVDFFELPFEKQPTHYLEFDDKQIPMYKLVTIMGTVLDKDKGKGIVTLLTPTGVVSVRVWKNQFSAYDRQISRYNPATGKNEVIEKSWFSRGNKLLVTGLRDGDNFIPKRYKNSKHPTVFSLITGIDEEYRAILKFEREVE